MAESVFEAVKGSVTVREAAQMYGIEVNRSGMACCPFHDDKNPSMKLNEEYFYCFGCGTTGDAIDFTARLYNLSPKEAAEKLAQDFGLAYDSQAPPRRRHVRQKSEAQKFKEDRDHAFRVLADYFHLLRKWETDYTDHYFIKETIDGNTTYKDEDGLKLEHRCEIGKTAVSRLFLCAKKRKGNGQGSGMIGASFEEGEVLFMKICAHRSEEHTSELQSQR